MSLASATHALVVDDFESMRRIIRNILVQMGFDQVDVAPDGECALRMLENGDYGLLVTDWSMPGMDGIELVRAVRADPRLAALAVLMVTAETTRDGVLRAIEAGVDEYLVKPFTQEALRAKIERLLASRAGAPASPARAPGG